MYEPIGKKETIDFEQGEFILVNKPFGWTSFDVVARIRSMFSVAKVGHAGTLDPRATGLLIVCTGKMTKAIDQFAEMEKEYIGTFELGAKTDSFDSETVISERKDYTKVTREDVESSFFSLTGEQQQLPPMFSAIKKNGRRLYKDARKGKVVERETRKIFVKEFLMTSFQLPYVGFKVVCSKGTYIRTLANDCGEKLGCGAYLKDLIRTRIGEYRLEDACSLEELHVLRNKFLTTVA